MTIPALPALNRASPTFRSDLDSYFLTNLPATTGAINEAILEIDADVEAAADSAANASDSAAAANAARVAALASAANAQSAALSAARAAGAVAWEPGAAYSIGTPTYSLINFQTYRRVTAGAGALDPALDKENWAPVTGGGSNAKNYYFGSM